VNAYVVGTVKNAEMKIFISSVRKGLEEERDALPGLIKALWHQPLRFEDFTAQDAPSRQACVDGVEASDAYLLLLGPHYGHVFPDTQQSATHDEWTTASRLGLPRYVFEKTGIDFDPEQEQFARTLGDYATGRFHGSFASATELLTKATAAIQQLSTSPSSLTFSPLTHDLAVPWLENDQQGYGRAAPLLEVHVVPTSGNRLSSRILEQVAAGLPGLARSLGVVSNTEAVDVNQTPEFVALNAKPAQAGGWNQATPGALSLVKVLPSGAVTVAYSMPRDTLGTIFDADEISGQVAAALRIAGQLDQSGSATFAIAAGITTRSTLSRGSVQSMPRSSGSTSSHDGPVRTLPDEVVSRAALDQGSSEVAGVVTRSLNRAMDSQ
jgi:hypothetical protein